jgi:putative acetyltransferase
MIRKYNEKDADAIVELWFASSSLAHPFLSDEFMAAERINLRELYLPNTENWVAELDGKVVGFIALIEDEVGGFFVDPVYHSRKIGLALMDHAVAQKGALKLDVFRDNKLGRRFYDRYGFQISHEYIHDKTGFPLLHLTYVVSKSTS